MPGEKCAFKSGSPSRRHGPAFGLCPWTDAPFPAKNAQATAQRELKEELAPERRFAGESPFMMVTSGNVFENFHLLDLDVDVDSPQLQEKEIQQVPWASEQEIPEMIDEGSFIGYHRSLLRLLFNLKQ